MFELRDKVRQMMFLRKASVEKEPQLVDWLRANEDRNAFDEAVLSYPLTQVYAAHNNGTTYACMPVQPVAMLESVGTNPQSTSEQIVEAMIELVKGVELQAQSAGYREMMFLVSDEGTANGAKLLGFEEVPCHKIMRKRLQ